METAFLRVHCPYVEYIRIDSKSFHEMWNELVFAYRNNLRLEHIVTETFYQLNDNGMLQLVEKECYTTWEYSQPYQFGYLLKCDGEYIPIDAARPDIPIT